MKASWGKVRIGMVAILGVVAFALWGFTFLTAPRAQQDGSATSGDAASNTGQPQADETAEQAAGLSTQISSQSACMLSGSPLSQCEISQAEGFDLKCPLDTATMETWWNQITSPYYVANMYMGGRNANKNCYPAYLISTGCTNESHAGKTTTTTLNSSWVNEVRGFGSTAQGWSLMPIWVGPQAPCADAASSYCLMGTDPTQPAPCTTADPLCAGKDWAACAIAEGIREADEAACAATAAGGLGFSSSIIYYDMEAYTDSGAPSYGGYTCTQLVQNFTDGWVDELHAQGFIAGVYGQGTSSEPNVQNLSPATTAFPPDAVWFANWNWNGILGTDSPWEASSIGMWWPLDASSHQYCSDPGLACTGYGSKSAGGGRS